MTEKVPLRVDAPTKAGLLAPVKGWIACDCRGRVQTGSLKRSAHPLKVRLMLEVDVMLRGLPPSQS